MAFKLFCLYVAATCAFAAPPGDVVPLEKQQPTVIPILAQSEELEANGTYKYSYETANGIRREETSFDKVLPKGKSAPSSDEDKDQSDESNEIHVQQGSYSYTAPDGTLISVRYIADENGFRVVGDHIHKELSVDPTSIGERRAKTLAQDNAEVASAPGPAIATQAVKAPKPPKLAKAPEAPVALESSLVSEASQSSKPPTSEVPQTPKEKASQESETPKAPERSQLSNLSSIESRAGENISEPVSTAEPNVSEASSEKTTLEPSSEPSNTPESPITTEALSEPSTTPEQSTTEGALTTESASLTTGHVTETTSTVVPDQSTTTEAASTSEASSEPSTLEVSSESVSTIASEPSTTEGAITTLTA